MRKLILAAALSCVSVGFAGMASAESLKASDCRPLTSSNAERCCAAANLKNLLSPQDKALCRTWSTQTVVSPATALGTPSALNPPGNPPGVPPGSPENGINNGFGNGDQNPPGSSGPNNNAENDVGGRANPSNSSNSSN